MLIAEIKPDYAIGTTDVPVPELPPHGALLKVTGCGLCGSDLDKFLLKKAQPGSVLGHEVTGIIEMIAEPDGKFAVGDRIVAAHHVPCGACHFCLNDSESMCPQFKATNLLPGGFAERLALSEGHLQNTVFKIPPHTSDAEASCVEPLACVLKAVRRSPKLQNGTVAITGLGFIGMLAAQAYQRLGYRVIGLDLDADRLQLAQQQNWVNEALDARCVGDEFTASADIVFLTLTSEPTIRQALSLLRDGGTIVLFAGPQPRQNKSEKDASLPSDELYFREISVIPSYSPALQDLREAARMIFDGDISVKPLITHTLPLAQIAHAFELYQSGQALKVFITP